ncbi:MAG: response regulator transcription factor [Lentisphaerae bacterium]|nr:response regulator transcription factor [Lentisphaerota bacterium]
MTKVAVVDDHGVVLAGLKFVLSRAEGMEVVATAESADDIIGFYEKTNPDVLLLDIRMPSVSGLDALETLRKVHPDAKVAMLTTSELEEDIFRALKLGANGYIPKDSRPSEIANAVKAIAAGGTYVPEDIQRIFDMRQEVKSLSARELSILQLAAKGFSNPEVGEMLGISVNSVKTHFRHIFEKMDVSDRMEAVTLAISRGIIER